MSDERPRYAGFVSIYDTVPLNIHHESAEQGILTKDLWNPVSEKDLLTYRNGAALGNDALSEVFRTFILQDESLDSPMTREQMNHRIYIINNLIIRHALSASNPMPAYKIHNINYHFAPATFRWVDIGNELKERIGSRMFLYRNPHATEGSMYWSYVNKLFTETNTILTQHGQPNMPLHRINT